MHFAKKNKKQNQRLRSEYCKMGFESDRCGMSSSLLVNNFVSLGSSHNRRICSLICMLRMIKASLSRECCKDWANGYEVCVKYIIRIPPIPAIITIAILILIIIHRHWKEIKTALFGMNTLALMETHSGAGTVPILVPSPVSCMMWGNLFKLFLRFSIWK